MFRSNRPVAAALIALGIGFCGFAAAPALAVAEDNPVVAVVNGEPIHYSKIGMMAATLPPQLRQLPPQQFLQLVIQKLVDQKLLSQAAEKAGMTESESFRDQLSFTRDDILQEMYLRQVIQQGMTDDRIKAAYDQLASEKTGVAQVHARHILLRTETEAQEVITALQGGADFASLAQEKSIGPSSSRGGDLGFFGKDEMVEPFAEVAFSLQPGQISQEPVQTQFGWHVIKVEEQREAPAPDFDSTVPSLRQQEAGRLIEETLNDLRNAAQIELKEPPAAAAGSQ